MWMGITNSVGDRLTFRLTDSRGKEMRLEICGEKVWKNGGKKDERSTLWHFFDITQTLSSLDPFYQGHMQSLPNAASQRQLTFLQFTCSPGSVIKIKKKQLLQTSAKGEHQAGEKQWGDEEEEAHTGKGWPQFCVFWVLPQLCLFQQNTSHIKEGELSGAAGETQQREKVSGCTETLGH